MSIVTKNNINNTEQPIEVIVLNNDTITTTTGFTVTDSFGLAKEINFVVRIANAPTGTTPTVRFDLYDVDPIGGGLTGTPTSSSVFTAATIATIFTHYTKTGRVQVVATVTGTTPSFTGVYLSLTGKDATNITPITDVLPTSLGQKVSASSFPVVIASDQLVSASITNDMYSSYSPDPSSIVDGQGNQSLDASGRQETHSTILTDEGSFRDDFNNGTAFVPLTLTGTALFTNGSVDIVGTGTLFTTQLKAGDYIKKSLDAESLYVQVDSIVDDATLVLSSPYAGTTASSAIFGSKWKTNTGSGASILTASSTVVILNPTTTGISSWIEKSFDYMPVIISASMAIGSRNANQRMFFGFQDQPISPNISCRFEFTGTDNTVVTCISQVSTLAAEKTSTNIFMPTQANTSTQNRYEIDISNNSISFVINGILVAQHFDHIPDPYASLSISMGVENTGATVSSGIVCDWASLFNTNQVEISNTSKGEPLEIKGSVSILDGVRQTYSASFVGVLSANLATDIFSIYGSATALVRINRLFVTATRSSNNNSDVLLIKRSSVNTAGTSTIATNVPHDSTNKVSSVIIKGYTANPTLGTTVGIVRAEKIFINTVGTGASDKILWDFGGKPSQAIVLRGTSQGLCVNLNGVTIGGGNYNFYIEWTEEQF